MSCEGNRLRFFRHSDVTGPGSAAAAAFGNAQAAAAALEQIFNVARNRPFDPSTHLGKAAQLLAEQKTRLLFRAMEKKKLKPPTHSDTGLPKLDAQRGYAAVFDTLKALDQQTALPALAEDVRRAQQRRVQINHDLPSCLEMATRLRTATGTVGRTVLDALIRRLPTTDNVLGFAQSALGLDAAPEFKAVGGGIGKGVSGAPVFIVRSAQGQPVGIMKIFPDVAQFGEELSALTWLEEQGFQAFHVPRILNAATTAGSQGPQGVLVTSYAAGLPVDDLIRRAAYAGDDRQALRELDAGVCATAAGLAALHRGSRIDRAPSAATLARHTTAVRDISQKMAANQMIMDLWPGDATSFQHEVDTVIRDFEHHIPPESVVTHGDAHPGNFFADAAIGVTFIDTPSLHRSLDQDGAATDIASRDIDNFQEKLRFFGHSAGLAETDIARLNQSFVDAYHRAGGAAIHPAVSRFFQTRTALGETIKLARHVADGSAPYDHLVMQMHRVESLLNG